MELIIKNTPLPEFSFDIPCEIFHETLQLFKDKYNNYYNEIFLHSSALINGNRHDNVIKKFGNVLDLLFLPYTKNIII